MKCCVCDEDECGAQWDDPMGAASPGEREEALIRHWRLGYERLRASLTTAEKALSRARNETLYAAAEVASINCGICDDKELPDGPCLIAVKILALAEDAAPAANKAFDSSAPEKALGALRAVVSEAWFMLRGGDDPRERCTECGHYGEGMLRDALHDAERLLSGGAHVDGPKAGDLAEKEGEG